MEAFFVLLGLVVVFGPIALAIVALVRSSAATAELAVLRTRIADLESQLVPPAAGGKPATAPLWTAAAYASAPEAPAPAEPPEAETESAGEAAPPPLDAPAMAPAAIAAPPAAPAESISRGGFEKSFASKWLVWLGAATLALGGTFLVKHSIEHGWLGPAVRELVGLAFGLALLVGGEWLRRRPLERAIAAVQPDYVPPALSAAGLFTLFACAYTSYALYGLIGPLVAFAALAATAFIAVGLSLLQGPPAALLGVVGGFVTPMLVASTEPSAWTLFPYLLALSAAGLAVLRYRAWWWLGYAVLAGAAFWPLIWFAEAWAPADALPLGLYLLALAAGFCHFTRGFSFAGRPWQGAGDKLSINHPDALTWATAGVTLLLFFAYVRTGGYDPISLIALGALCLLYLYVGRRQPGLDALAPAAAVLVLALAATWHLPSVLQQFAPAHALRPPLLPPELVDFAVAAAGFGALFGAAGFVALWGARRPGLWAGVSAGTPTLLFTIAYWRFVDFGLDLGWAAAALALAVVTILAASRVARYRGPPELEIPLGLYAAAVTAFVALGAAMTLQQAWLTVAYAAQLLALALIYQRVTVEPLRWVALATAAVVLARLVLNWNVLGYDGGSPPVFGWVLYGYGLPALMFFEAARRFRRHGDDLLVAVLEAGWIAFTVLLASLEIRVLVNESVTSLDYELLEQSLQTAAWLAIAHALMQAHARAPRPVTLWAARALLCLSALQVLLLQLVIFNPFYVHVFVGSYPVLNLLFLAYAVPAIFAFLSVPLLRRQGAGGAAPVAAGIGFLLTFVYLSLEVRRAFQGPMLYWTTPSDAELYAYSAAWLIYALVLLGLAIRLRRASLRYASLIALSITVLKVFLVDTADLTGLYRVASFLGLGLCLIAIGYIYQRFVFPVGPGRAGPPPATAAAAAPTQEQG